MTTSLNIESLTVEQQRLLAAEELLILERELQRRLCLGSLKQFVRYAWPIVEPKHALAWNWHLDLLCVSLEKISRGEVQRAIFNVPPGTMKSLLVSVFYRAWLWARNPGLRFLAASYGAHLSVRDNVKLRDIITSPWYRALFPGPGISGNQNESLNNIESMVDFHTEQRRLRSNIQGSEVQKIICPGDYEILA